VSNTNGETHSPHPSQTLKKSGSKKSLQGTERLISSCHHLQDTVVAQKESQPNPLPIPNALERTIKLKKGEEPLGISVEVPEGSVNGVNIVAIQPLGPVARDGRMQCGDCLVAVNNESLRNVTSAQTKAILRRAQLFSKDLRYSQLEGICVLGSQFRENFIYPAKCIEKQWQYFHHPTFF